MSQWPPAMQLMGIGWYVAVCIVCGILLGLWLDGELGISPALTLLGLALGLAAAGWGGYRMLQQLFAAQQRQRDEQQGSAASQTSDEQDAQGDDEGHAEGGGE